MTTRSANPKPATIPGRTVRTCDRGLEIRFEHDRRIVNVVRQIPHRRFDWTLKVWTVPMTSLPEVIDLLEGEGFDLPADLYGRLPAILKEREQKAEQSKARKAEREAAAAKLDAHTGPIAFVPAGDVLLTRRLKAHGIYRVVREETKIGDSHVKQTIGYKVPDSLLIETLAELDRPTDPASRLIETLRALFTVDREARRLRPDSGSASYRHGKRDGLITEACRLAVMHDVDDSCRDRRFTWGWQRNEAAKSDGSEWCLYFERDGEQLRFFHRKREAGPEFPGAWDQQTRVRFPWPTASVDDSGRDSAA